MIGRGTSLCPELLGPGQDKPSFHLFNYCQNLEHFSQNPEMIDGALGESLSKRLFNTRLDLIELKSLIASERGRVNGRADHRLRKLFR